MSGKARRKRSKSLAAQRWPAMDVPDAPSSDTWRREAEKEIVLLRMLTFILRDDSEAQLSRMRKAGHDPETWRAFLDMAGSFNDHARRLKERAGAFEIGAARIVASIERVSHECTDCLPALEEAARRALDDAREAATA